MISSALYTDEFSCVALVQKHAGRQDWKQGAVELPVKLRVKTYRLISMNTPQVYTVMLYIVVRHWIYTSTLAYHVFFTN